MSKSKQSLIIAAKKDTLIIALHKANGNLSEACKLCGISRATLYRYLEDADYKKLIDEVVAKPNPKKYLKHDVRKKAESDGTPIANLVTVEIPSFEDYKERTKNGAQPQYAAAAKLAYANAIAELYEQGVLTIAECCERVELSHKTFWLWRTVGQYGYSEAVAMRWQQAENYLLSYKSEIIINNARMSLEKLTQEREVVETHRTGRMVDVEEEYVNELGELKKRTVQQLQPWEVKNVVKKIQPNMTAITMALRGLDKQFVDAAKPVDNDNQQVDRYTLKGMDLEQLAAEKERYKKLLEQNQ